MSPRCLAHVSVRRALPWALTILLSGGVSTAGAWDLSNLVMQNMATDQQFNNQLNGMMANTYAQQQQLMQSYIQAYGPQLRQEYQQYLQTTGAQISFEQFVYYHMMTAGGTNAGPALQQQQQNFRALQQANQSLQQGYDSYNQGWWNNSQTMDQTLDNYDNQAIRGNAYYGNPYTGETYNLPYTSGPGYYGGSDEAFYQDPTGRYYQEQPGGYYEDLEPTSPYDD